MSLSDVADCGGGAADWEDTGGVVDTGDAGGTADAEDVGHTVETEDADSADWAKQESVICFNFFLGGSRSPLICNITRKIKENISLWMSILRRLPLWPSG